MTAIAKHFAAAPEAAVFDSLTFVADDAGAILSTAEDANASREYLDPPVEDYGKIVARFAGGIALTLGTIDTLRTGGIMTLQAATSENIEWSGIQLLAKDAPVVIGAFVFLKYGVNAVDRWWNKDIS